jgi:hypothetical protein
MLRVSTVVMIGAMVLSIPGCGKSGVHFEPGDLDLAKCTTTEPVKVEALDDTPRAQCDLAGVDIVFPDGATVSAPEMGSVRSRSSGPAGIVPTQTLFNLGIYGIVAAQTSAKTKQTEWWGTPEGIQKEQAATGTYVPLIDQ